MKSAFEKMDKMYRHQRYFYDFTRKYYLLGRDKLISEMDVQEGENILEIGCGTGRNLTILAKKYPNTNFYGLDASAAMLETAQKKVDANNFKNVNLENALADDFSYNATFNLEKPFDTIFFSYSITMIPTWKESIQNALENMESGRSFYIVDFYDQRDLPKWFQKILQIWLEQFHVIYPQELIPYLKNLEANNTGKLSLKSIYKSYSFIIRFTKY
ncbi:MAG: class I SAM-dependent methyltransferase [Acidobacteriota bacterium]|jgi:S-adenosylmethionine-diacylgycerolhomoserine-N-methlytransferase|nr:class I SAM-dependent methyltransferase [Acidobacteriota bacterium]